MNSALILNSTSQFPNQVELDSLKRRLSSASAGVISFDSTSPESSSSHISVARRLDRRFPVQTKTLDQTHPPVGRNEALNRGRGCAWQPHMTALSIDMAHASLVQSLLLLGTLQRPKFFRDPSTLDPQPSTLNPQPSTLDPRPSTLDPQPSTLNPEP